MKRRERGENMEVGREEEEKEKERGRQRKRRRHRVGREGEGRRKHRVSEEKRGVTARKEEQGKNRR